MNIERLDSIVGNFSGAGIAVIGDMMLDRYIWGDASRISQEAPVPVVAVNRMSAAPGGAANVIRNLATLGARPIPFGLVGDDAAGRELRELLAAAGAECDGLIVCPERHTTEKTRVLAGSQQVVRIDREDSAAISTEHRSALVVALEEACASGRVQGIIIEDYAKGCITHELLEAVIAIAGANDIPALMDPHPAHRYQLPGLTLMTPNRHEAFALAGAYEREAAADPAEDGALQAVVDTLHQQWASRYLLVTLGARGMALYCDGALRLHVHTRAREVFDVSGAGDTVISTFALALLGGGTPEEAAEIANYAAGEVVAKVGTATIAQEELRRAIVGG